MGYGEIWDDVEGAGVLTSRSTVYGQKLTREQRCEILALFRLGASTRVLATHYGVSSFTVRGIVNSSSRSYKDIRAECDRMGSKHFAKEYVSPSLLDTIKAVESSVVSTIDEQRARAELKPNKHRSDGRGAYHWTQPYAAIVRWFEQDGNAWGWGWFKKEHAETDGRVVKFTIEPGKEGEVVGPFLSAMDAFNDYKAKVEERFPDAFVGDHGFISIKDM